MVSNEWSRHLIKRDTTNHNQITKQNQHTTKKTAYSYCWFGAFLFIGCTTYTLYLVCREKHKLIKYNRKNSTAQNFLNVIVVINFFVIVVVVGFVVLLVKNTLRKSSFTFYRWWRRIFIFFLLCNIIFLCLSLFMMVLLYEVSLVLHFAGFRCPLFFHRILPCITVTPFHRDSSLFLHSVIFLLSLASLSFIPLTNPPSTLPFRLFYLFSIFMQRDTRLSFAGACIFAIRLQLRFVLLDSHLHWHGRL